MLTPKNKESNVISIKNKIHCSIQEKSPKKEVPVKNASFSPRSISNFSTNEDLLTCPNLKGAHNRPNHNRINGLALSDVASSADDQLDKIDVRKMLENQGETYLRYMLKNFEMENKEKQKIREQRKNDLRFSQDLNKDININIIKSQIGR